MKEKPEFIGARYGKKEKISNEKHLLKWSKEGMEPMEGEMEKTEEDIKMLNMLNDFIKDEMLSLGIKHYEPLPAEKVHILPQKIFEKHNPQSSKMGGSLAASFNPADDTLYINKGVSDSRALMLMSILHEALHRTSTMKFYADKKTIYNARIGYSLKSAWKKEGRQKKLSGFNELMVHYTTLKILLKNIKKLEKLGISKKDIKGVTTVYDQYYPILALITKKVSEDTGIPPDQVFANFEKGQFQKTILALKDIEKSFGRGSLKILSLLGEMKNPADNDKLAGMIELFFAEKNAGEREKIRKKIIDFSSQNRASQSD